MGFIFSVGLVVVIAVVLMGAVGVLIDRTSK
jgi:hypothetical protein